MLLWYVFTVVQNYQTKLAAEMGFHVFSDPNRFSCSYLAASCHKTLHTGPLMGHDFQVFFLIIKKLIQGLFSSAIGFNWLDSIILVSVTKFR